MTTVSVVIPAYNQAEFLVEAIESVLRQRRRADEIIVVDDGSTDETPAVVQRYGGAVRYLHQQNQGLAAARNTGIQAAQGDLIALLDSDDAWLPDYLARMMAAAAEHPEVTVFFCGARCIDGEGRTLPQTVGAPTVPSQQLYQALLRANFLIPSTVMMRREPVVNAGLFDVRFRRVQDWELWIRLLKAGHRFFGIGEILAYYRIHGASLSTDPIGGQQAVMALAVKHFGVDDGQWQTWAPDKRRMYGGVYRYCVLSAVQRQQDWQAGARHLHRALQVEPTLSTDLDFFYDLALGEQPAGYRGTTYDLSVAENATHINSLLAAAFAAGQGANLPALRRQTYGTSYYALGLLAYNTGQLSLGWRYLLRALRWRPALGLDTRVVGTAMKSLLGPALRNKLKALWSRWQGKASHQPTYTVR